ncbi:YdcF family protein [Acetivibrio cellulolyticus]|uniref:YdcF family protein n=1 Tax=Acetivibrio cellulolyticus TaxID=35830 RepID=UPI0001E2D522|nr:YdcF family protein [Acetivibrio cellulolyticus]
MNTEIEVLAKVLWDYHHMNHALTSADLIIVLGSHDTRVAQRGAELYLKGFAPFIVISGGLGKITKHLWNMTEAEKFAEIACSMGVPEEKIILETRSTNTGENILFTRELILDRNLNINSIITVNKPYMERRTYAAFKKFWNVNDVMVTSPQFEFKEYLEAYTDGKITKEEIISIMVGDLQRIKVYAEKGFQIQQDIPENVWEAFDKLVELGFKKHLIK